MTEQLMIAPVLAPIVHGIDVLHFNAGFEDSFSADSSPRCDRAATIRWRSGFKPHHLTLPAMASLWQASLSARRGDFFRSN